MDARFGSVSAARCAGVNMPGARGVVWAGLVLVVAGCATSRHDAGRAGDAASAMRVAGQERRSGEGPAPTLEGWASETFALPPAFAPGLPAGSESLRFAPGWRTAGSEEFWSYAFVMWIDEDTPGAARIRAVLEEYYNGLLGAFASEAGRDISATPARIAIGSVSPGRFEATLHVIDAFATFEPIEVRVRVESAAEAAGGSSLRIQLSPKPGEHAIWRSLEAAIAAIVAQGRPSTPSVDKESGDEAAAVRVDPMQAFGKMLGGRWKMTAQSGTSMFDTWHWGPGRRSLRVMTDGQGADGRPWRSVSVYYWHPGLREIRTLGLQPVFRGINEGSIRFDGERAEGFSQLHQSGGTRQMGLRWRFEGDDKYHDELIEQGADGYEPLASWDRIRVSAEPGHLVVKQGSETKPSELLRPCVELLGGPWVSAGEDAAGELGAAGSTRASFEYVPYADAILGRVERISADGAALHAMDVYLFHHTGLRRLRCLALGTDARGGAVVYEGDVTAGAEGRGLAMTLKASQADTGNALESRLDFEANGAMRQRVWAVENGERRLTSDARFERTR